MSALRTHHRHEPPKIREDQVRNEGESTGRYGQPPPWRCPEMSPDPRVRVLHVVLNIHEGGLERVVGDLVRGIDPARIAQHILVLQFPGRLSMGLDAYATLHVAPTLSPWSMLWPAKLARMIRDIAPDVVHTHSGVWYKASLASRMADVPYLVHTEHGRQSPDPWLDRFVDGWASTRTDTVIAVSEALAAQLAKTVVRDAARIRLLRNGVDTDRFRSQAGGADLRAELGIPKTALVFGSIGRLYEIKRFDLMLGAFARLLDDWTGGRRPVLVIAGDGPERERLDAMLADLGLEGKAYLLGWRDDVQDLHRLFDVFTMSSRSEGTSIGLLEAMSAEVCPVVTNVGGNPAVLGRELAHRLYRSESIEALVAAWWAALTDTEKLLEDGERARARVVQYFSVRRMVEEHTQLYVDGASTL